MLPAITALCWTVIGLVIIRRFTSLQPASLQRGYGYGAFLGKVLLGCGNYYIWIHVIGHGDSLRYVHDSLVVYDSLPQHPLHFLQLITRTSLDNVPEHLVPYQQALFIEWHVPEYNMVRLLAVFNVFTFGSAWGNIVLMSLLIYAAEVALFNRLIMRLESDARTGTLLYIALFAMPSIIFWSSGLLKEGPVLALLCLLAAQMLKWPEAIHRHEKLRIGLFVLAILSGLFLIRDYVAILCVVNLLGIWAVSLQPALRRSPILSCIMVAIVLSCAVLGIAKAHPGWDLFLHLRNEQTYFTLSGTDPDYPFHLLTGTPADVLQKIPYAVNNVLFRPNLLHGSSAFRYYQAAELLICWIFLVALLLRRRFRIPQNLTGAFFFMVCIELLFLYGLMVTDADTLSRYRSVPLMGLLVLTITATGTKRERTAH